MGYHLTIVKEGQCVSSKVSSMVKSFVSTAEQVLDVGAELTFTLPSSESSNFPKLFDQLEGKSKSHAIPFRLEVFSELRIKKHGTGLDVNQLFAVIGYICKLRHLLAPKL